MAEPQPDREQIAAVLQQLADHSSDEDLRGHVRQVAEALRGNGLVILDGPPQQALRAEQLGCYIPLVDAQGG